MSDDDSADHGGMIEQLFAHLAAEHEGGGDGDNGNEPEVAIDIEAIRLRDAFAAFGVQHRFAPGMIVRQKQQAKGYRDAGKHDLGIVVETLPEPVVLTNVENDAGSPYFRKPLDLIIGHRSKGHFVTFYVDSRHYEPVSERELKLRVKGSRRKQ